jgi:hypothetical protein
MENIYDALYTEKRRIEKELVCYNQEQANEDINFIFSSKPRMTVIKKEMSSFLEGLK